MERVAQISLHIVVGMSIQPVGNVRRIASLECVVVDPTAHSYEPDGLVILCHGFGASGTDLVDCCRAMWELQPEGLRHTRFVFPAGPLSLDPSGVYDSRAWWPLDMERLNEMIATGEFRDLRREKPELLERRREELSTLLTALADEAGLEFNSIVLGGFSQGAMLATDLALNLQQRVGGLIVWSGTLLNELEWKPAAAAHEKFPIFQSHGRFDPILPFAAAQWLHEVFMESDFAAEFVGFDGMHEIPMSAMRGAAKLAADVAQR